MKPGVFLDRDGTLIVERHYLKDPDGVELFGGAGRALSKLRAAGFGLFVVTNQSGIGRGYYTVDDMHRVNRRMLELLAPDGVHFDAIYYAPEAPEQPSRGRKPSPQFLWDARDAFGVDLGRSYMIGDKWIDLECGWNAPVRRSLLVRTGYGATLERERSSELGSAVVVDGLAAAAAWILADAGLSAADERGE